MGIIAITGGTRGIGLKAAECLRAEGHTVITIATSVSDINANLGTAEGRRTVIDELHRLCPDGLDGFICNHGISPSPKYAPSYILSVNYFGAVAVMNGIYGLLKMRHGCCVATASSAIVSKPRGKYFLDEPLFRCGDEERIGRLADTFPLKEDGFIMYASAKLALCRWIRANAASWAAGGVTLNAVAPGGVATDIMRDFEAPGELFYPMPALYGKVGAMAPIDVANVLAFMVSPESRGICGQIIFCDAGSVNIFNPGRSY